MSSTDATAARAESAGAPRTGAQAPRTAAPGRTRKPLSPGLRIGLAAGGVVALVVVLVLAMQWWTHGRFVQSTNDAYLRADAVTVAPKVSGYVETVYVIDNQLVTAGAPLVKIDTANYDAALARERATLQARQADVVSARKQVDQQQAAVAQARAQLAGAQVNAAYAAREAARFQGLAAQGVETAERAAQARNQRDQADTTVRTSAAAVATAQRQAATLTAQIAQADAGVQAQAASLKAANINLGDTLLRASIAGRIGDKSVRQGQLVQPGQRLMSVVPTNDIYLVANFKETQIARMRIGQAASVKVDALGGETIDAVVDSFAPGTGAQFALLPPENATGNFTKIVQRVPVRFRLRPKASARDHLLPGLSAKVSVDTTQAPDARR